MVEVRLHGALAAQFGKCWNLDIRTPSEAIAAIECGKRGFRAAIMKLSRAGMVFRVRSKDHDYDKDDLHMNLGGVSRIDIIPIVAGASAGVRFVVGALLVISTFVPGSPTLGNTFVQSAGASLMFGAVTEWLTPVQKKNDDAYKNAQSWTMGGPNNTAEQGNPVPIIYGEVMTGGYTISAGILVGQLSTSGVIGPSASIEGVAEHLISLDIPGSSLTARIQFTARTFNAVAPFTYSWSITGFAGALSATLENATTDSVTLVMTFDADTSPTYYSTYTGNVLLTVNAKDAASSSGIAPQAVVLNASKALTVTVDTAPYSFDGGT